MDIVNQKLPDDLKVQLVKLKGVAHVTWSPNIIDEPTSMTMQDFHLRSLIATDISKCFRPDPDINPKPTHGS